MSEWRETTISEIAKGIYDGPHATPKKIDFGAIFLGISNLEQGKINLSETQHLSDEDFKKWTKRVVPQENDLVFSYETRLGEAALIPKELRCCLGRRMALIRPNLEKVDPSFLLYKYLSPDFQNTISSRTIYGSTVNRIALKEFPEFPITIPSLEEQKAIAAVLSCLDAKIENLRKQNETLERIAQTLFKHWFIDFEFPNEDGKPFKSSGGAMIPSELGEIPVGWRVEKLGNFCTIFRGSSPRPISSPVFFKNGHIPWIKIADATKSNSIYLSETKEYCTEAALPHTRLLKKGSLILSNSATVGVPMILNLEGCIHDGWLSFKEYKQITRNFLFFTLVYKLKFLLQYADGSVQKNLNTGILKNMGFVLPLSDQIKKFTVLSQSVFDKILINEKQIQTLTKTRDTLLPKLMSGQLRVKDL